MSWRRKILLSTVVLLGWNGTSLGAQWPGIGTRLEEAEVVVKRHEISKALKTAQRLEQVASYSPLPEDVRAGHLHGVLGDLYLIAGNLQLAAQQYRKALDTGEDFRTRRGLLYQNKIYLNERFDDEKWGAGATTCILAMDPVSAKVTERYYLPGIPRFFTVEGEALKISYSYQFYSYESEWEDDEDTLTGIRIVRGQLDRPASYGLWIHRLYSMRPANSFAVNFLYQPGADGETEPSSEFIVREIPYGDAPATLEDLKTALRDAQVRDPTQPWYPFLLGQAQWSDRQFSEAATTWQKIFDGGYPATPYYEFSWMAVAFERYGQRSWADRAFREALTRRRQHPAPIRWSYWIDLAVFTPFCRQNMYGNAWEHRDLERTHLWWQRSRALHGVSEGDKLRAGSWLAYHHRQKDLAREAQARDFLKTARSESFLLEQGAYWLDYTGWVFLPFLLSLGAVAIWVLLTLIRIPLLRCWRSLVDETRRFRASNAFPEFPGSGLWRWILRPVQILIFLALWFGTLLWRQVGLKFFIKKLVPLA